MDVFKTLILDTSDSLTSLTGTLPVTSGGTGRTTSTTAYGLIAAGTTATGALQTLPTGATTELLVGGGASALPVWTTATGSGSPVRATSPTLVTPVLGAATATSINGNTFTTGTYTLTGTAGKTLTFSNTLTLAGTDSTTMTFPSTSATIARTDAAQTFTGTQTFGVISGTDTISTSKAVSGSLFSGITVTNSSNTASSAAEITVGNGGTSSGSVRFHLSDSGTNDWYMGTVAASNVLTLGTSATSGGGQHVRIASSGLVTIANGGLTLSGGALTYGGVTLSNAVTGTGNMVLSAGPTFSGTTSFTGQVVMTNDNILSGINGTGGNGYLTGPSVAGKFLTFRSGNTTGGINFRDSTSTEVAQYNESTALWTFAKRTKVSDTTASTSTTTGSLINAGGFGNAGAFYNGGDASIGTAGANANLTIGAASPSGNNTSRLKFLNSNSVTNWQIASNDNVAGVLEFTASTATGGSTFSTPILKLSGTGATGVVTVAPTTASTSTTTGSLINAGGFGNAGAFYNGGNVSALGTSHTFGPSFSAVAWGTGGDLNVNGTTGGLVGVYYNGTAKGYLLANSASLQLQGHSSTQLNLQTSGGNVSVGNTGTVITANGTTEATTGGAGSLTTAGGIYAAKKIITASTVTTAAAVAWDLGAAAVVSPTSPNRTIKVTIAGVDYYIAAKTTND
jgi:hypothetical protein